MKLNNSWPFEIYLAFATPFLISANLHHFHTRLTIYR